MPSHGPNAASGVGLSDPLPSTASFVSSSPSQGSCAGTSVVVCQLGTIPKGVIATVIIVARLSTAGSVTNTAVVDGTETDTNHDGLPDAWELFEGGALRVLLLDDEQRSGRPTRRILYEPGGARIEIDPDGDGVFTPDHP